MSAPPEPLMTGTEICAYLRISHSELGRLARRPVNPLPAKKAPPMGWRARRADIDAWLDELEMTA